jgi:hypothetical protein
MTYEQQGDRVRLEMTREEFSRLILGLGIAAGMAHRDENLSQFYSWLAFANDLNSTNPNWIPYEIPPEHQRPPA